MLRAPWEATDLQATAVLQAQRLRWTQQDDETRKGCAGEPDGNSGATARRPSDRVHGVLLPTPEGSLQKGRAQERRAQVRDQDPGYEELLFSIYFSEDGFK